MGVAATTGAASARESVFVKKFVSPAMSSAGVGWGGAGMGVGGHGSGHGGHGSLGGHTAGTVGFACLA